MKLTARAIGTLKPRDKTYRVADGAGLCLEIAPSGSKLRRYRYRFMGRALMIGLGTYPRVGLAQARRLSFTGQHNLE